MTIADSCVVTFAANGRKLWPRVLEALRIWMPYTALQCACGTYCPATVLTPACAVGRSRWHAGTIDDRVAARVTGVAGMVAMEPLAEEIGPAFQPPTQVPDD